MKKRIISLALVALTLFLTVSVFSSCKKDPYEVTHRATIVIRDYGTIELELYGNAAPKTVENFVRLANSGFYNGLTFHRIISGFMIQGGGFNENGIYKEAENIKGEFSSNGVNNPILHERGVISMARGDDMDSGSSQFFIMHQKSPHLDGDYAAFGKVTSGIEVVDDICYEVEQGYNGAVAVRERPVIVSVTVEKV
jgi:peptidyl-prolyl cis-trans isomerase B (cyclophilin B)